MKFTVLMKTPDALDSAIEQAAEDEVGGPSDSPEHDERYEQEVTKAKAVAAKWFRYGECLQVEIDTEAETCTVQGG